eukprot:PhF_6_TR37645/c0_g1_i1/m.56012
MASKLTRRSSSNALAQNCPSLLSKTLETVGCRPQDRKNANPTGDVVDIPYAGSGNTDTIMQALLASLVKEACGAAKGVVKRDEGDLEIDSEQLPPKTPFSDIVKQLHFSFDDLPDDLSVSAIAELTYGRILRKFNGSQVTIINNFPKALRPDNCDRLDLSVNNIVLISLRSAGNNSILRVHVGNVDGVMGRMCS